MKVLLFALGPGLGAYTVQLAQGLGQRDDVTVLLRLEEERELREYFPNFFQKARFRTVGVPHYPLPDPRKALQAVRVFRLIRQLNPDVIHVTNCGVSPESYFALRLADWSGLPMAVTIHDATIHPGDYRNLRTAWVEIRTQELGRQVIVHGRQQADLLIEGLGVDPRIVQVIPHGHYDLYFESAGMSRTVGPVPGRVLFFGRMKRYKGLEVLLRAAPLVARQVPNLSIVSAGSGEEMDRLKPRFEAMPCFRILDRYIAAGEAASLFQEASVLVLPYTEASQSGPLHLAFSFGRPTVATRVGAIPESLTHGREGLLVPPNDPEALASALAEILLNPELASKMGRAARRKADVELDWSGTIAERTRQVYEEAIRLKQARARYAGIGAQARWRRYKALYREEGRRERAE